jgi:hypothetical protein
VIFLGVDVANGPRLCVWSNEFATIEYHNSIRTITTHLFSLGYNRDDEEAKKYRHVLLFSDQVRRHQDKYHCKIYTGSY